MSSNYCCPSLSNWVNRQKWMVTAWNKKNTRACWFASPSYSMGNYDQLCNYAYWSDLQSSTKKLTFETIWQWVSVHLINQNIGDNNGPQPFVDDMRLEHGDFPWSDWTWYWFSQHHRESVGGFLKWGHPCPSSLSIGFSILHHHGIYRIFHYFIGFTIHFHRIFQYTSSSWKATPMMETSLLCKYQFRQPFLGRNVPPWCESCHRGSRVAKNCLCSPQDMVFPVKGSDVMRIQWICMYLYTGYTYIITYNMYILWVYVNMCIYIIYRDIHVLYIYI